MIIQGNLIEHQNVAPASIAQELIIVYKVDCVLFVLPVNLRSDFHIDQFNPLDSICRVDDCCSRLCRVWTVAGPRFITQNMLIHLFVDHPIQKGARCKE